MAFLRVRESAMLVEEGQEIVPQLCDSSPQRSTSFSNMPWTVPSPLAPLYAYFPLLIVSNDDSTTPAPSKPTLWVLGPPPTGHQESLDPVCRQAQAFARFSGMDCQPRYLSDGLGAPGGTLPSLHLPQGDLIETERVVEWIEKNSRSSDGGATTKQSQEEKEDSTERPIDPVVQAYTSLVETTLLPAVVAALYLLPSSAAPSVTPTTSLPWLSNLAAKWLGIGQKQEKISQVKKLRGGKVGKNTVLDLEEVEREAVEALEALEEKFEGQKKDERWFLGANSPTQLDASVYSLLSIISVLPAKGDSGILRTTLERCPNLSRWYKSHEP
ncbi:uncharacterized protein JCM6883_003947 [Sporobolomyces salmoneus]|uniref:uncharacterized protein n=1 Tax=Sporobolomyces salmoneus TaxID=183962 RepID=UPI00317B8DAD